MFHSFELMMNKYLTPIANRMDKQRHLSAIKKAMVAMTPLLIIGSLCLIPEALANMIPNNAVSDWILANLTLINLPFTLGMGMMGLYVAICIAYHLGDSYKLHIPGSVLMGTVAFLLCVASFDEDGGLVTRYLGTKGLFAAMLSSMLAVELYRWCIKRKFTIKMPAGVPDFVSRSFEMIPVSIIVIGTFLLIRQASLSWMGVLPPEILTNFLSPLVGSMDNPFAFMFLQFISCFLFFFGIHPSVLSPITSPISTQFFAENVAAQAAGLPMEHFYTGGVISAFANFTGTGVAFGLIFWCLRSKSKAQKKVGQVSLVPALFGINEPLLFGAPIVLNPTFFLPFVIGGAILGTFPAFLMEMGWLNMPWINPPYVGVFLEGFLVNLDWRTIIVNAIQMIGSILLWYPFFKMYEKKGLEEEAKNMQQTAYSPISSEDAALIGDLELDF